MVLYIQYSDDNSIVTASTSKISENENGKVAEVETEDYLNILMNLNDYKFEDGQLIKAENLDYYRKVKNEELNVACNNAISSGFDYEINGILYHFSFDIEAQLNYQGAERLLSEGTVNSIDFTVFHEDTYARIAIGKDEMKALALAILKHKSDNISKYRDVLLPQVQNATTKEEIQNIKW